MGMSGTAATGTAAGSVFMAHGHSTDRNLFRVLN